MMKKVRSFLCLAIALVLFTASFPIADFAIDANAATTINYSPNPKVEYSYSTGVSAGTIRYISQINGSTYFNWNYWPSANFGEYYGPGGECLTASISMALSYIGINKMPKDILHPNSGGITYWDGWGVTVSYPSLNNAIANYNNGNGKYSPPIVHFTTGYDSWNGDPPSHYVLLIAQITSNSYLVLDPAESNTWILSTNDAKFKSIDKVAQYYNPNASIPSSVPATIIKTSYPSHCTIKVTENDKNIMSLPCSNKTNSKSDKVESAPKGTTYEAIGLILNTEDNLWYKVKAKNGKEGYIFAGNVSFVSAITSDITGPGISVSSNHTHGKTYVLTGSVNSSYNELTNVSAYVYSGSNKITGGTASVNGKSYSLGRSAIDNQTEFNKLAVGQYTYKVTASYKSYYAKTDKTYGTKTGTVNVYSQTFNVVSGSVAPTQDTQKPTIVNAYVSELKSTGYELTCTFTDNVGVTRAWFPTWTSANGQDDLVGREGTISGNTAKCWISTSDHNNEFGEYITHIYLYDAAGNNICHEIKINVSSDASKIIYPTNGGIYKIAYGGGNNMYLDFALSGNNVQIYENCDGHSDPAFVKSQYFKLTHVGDGWYSIINIGNGKSVDIEGVNPTSGTNIQQWEYLGNNGQLYRFYDAGNGYCYIKSKLGTYIDKKDGDTSSDTNVWSYAFNGTVAQKWKLEKHSHSYISQITKSATCTTTGNRTYTCAKCAHTYNEKLAKNSSNHINIKNVAEVKATCTTKGSTAGVYCNDCKTYISGHKEISKNPSNHVNTKKVAAVAATTEKVGYTEGVYCNDCKKYISGHNEIPKLTIAIGDLDGDGVIKAADARLALRASVGLETLDSAQKKAADVDGDGMIKAADARLILRASVGLEDLKKYKK